MNAWFRCRYRCIGLVIGNDGVFVGVGVVVIGVIDNDGVFVGVGVCDVVIGVIDNDGVIVVCDIGGFLSGVTAGACV